MKIRVYYFLVADDNEDGMPIDGPFNTRRDVADHAMKEYGDVIKETVNKDETVQIREL